MQSTSLDSLLKSQLPMNPARAILDAVDLEITAREEVLATKSEMQEALHALQMEIQGFRGDFRAEIQALRSELVVKIAESEAKLARWVLTCTLGQSAMIGGAVYFALKHLR